MVPYERLQNMLDHRFLFRLFRLIIIFIEYMYNHSLYIKTYCCIQKKNPPRAKDSGGFSEKLTEHMAMVARFTSLYYQNFLIVLTLSAFPSIEQKAFIEVENATSV